MDKKVSPEERSTISLTANQFWATPTNYLRHNYVIPKGDFGDKIAKGGGEDQPGRRLLLSLNKVYMPK